MLDCIIMPIIIYYYAYVLVLIIYLILQSSSSRRPESDEIKSKKNVKSSELSDDDLEAKRKALLAQLHDEMN